MDFIFDNLFWFIVPLVMLMGYFLYQQHSKKQIELFKKLRLQRDGVIKAGEFFANPSFEFNHEGTLFSLGTFSGGKQTPPSTYLWVQSNTSSQIECLIEAKSSYTRRPFQKPAILDLPEVDSIYWIRTQTPELLKEALSESTIQALTKQSNFLKLKLEPNQYYFSVIGYLNTVEDLEKLITTATLLYDILTKNKKDQSH